MRAPLNHKPTARWPQAYHLQWALKWHRCSLTVAINALQSVIPHRFLGINSDGKVSVVKTRGNPFAHVVLRGGNDKPNYDSVSVLSVSKS